MNAPFPLPSEATDAPAPCQSVATLAPAPLQSEATNSPEIPESSGIKESLIPAAPIYIDLDFLDEHKIASQPPYRLSFDAWR